ncbi:MAG: hypothetical protein ACJ8LG_01065 [Massilia sp.]
MRKLSDFSLWRFWLLCLAGCATQGATPDNAVVLRYQHVANAREIHFSNPVEVAGRRAPVQFVTPRDAYGFWAIFVLCSIDTRASVLPGFRYDVERFRVAYGGQTFGNLRPYTLRYEGRAELNSPADSPAIAHAIGAEIHEGPATAAFGRGLFPALNYRFAIYVPRALPDYAGEQLMLSYTGQPAVLRGNGYPPSDIPVVGGNGAGIAASCLP